MPNDRPYQNLPSHQMGEILKSIAIESNARMSVLEFRNAHLEGRIRFYLDVLRGDWKALTVDQLPRCIEDDLARLAEMRANEENA